VLSQRARSWLWLSAFAQFVLLYGLAWARFHNVHQRTFDLALYARIAFGLARGDLTTPVLDTVPLATHLSPVLLPLGLLGRVLPLVHVLLAVQAACVALCIFPIARIGARHMGSSGASLASAAWWLYPNVFHVATYEFHPGTLALLPICWAFDALERGQVRQLAMCCAGVLLCREDFGLMCALFALLSYLRFARRQALVLAACCVAYTGIALWVVFAHAPTAGSLDQHFGPWGGSPLGVLRVLNEDPARVLAHFRAPGKLWYLPRLLAVLSFFPLRAAWLLIPALPYLGLNLLSVFPTSTEQYSHYLTPCVPALVVAGVVGATEIRKRALRNLWLFTLALGHFALGGSPLARDFDREAFRPDGATLAARELLARIPERASVEAPDPLLPHLVERRVLRRAPPPMHGAEFIAVDVSHRARFARREDLLRTSEEPFIRRLLARNDLGLVAYAPPYALFARGRTPRETPVARSCFVPAPTATGPAIPMNGCLSAVDALVEGSTLRLVVRAQGPCPADLALRLGPEQSPYHVELLCAGKLSPAQLRPGDYVETVIELSAHERRLVVQGAIWVGAVRASGKTLASGDPLAVRVAVRQHGQP
jgi:uncharacterized membrane protein